ncbi:hypothetical protein QTP88_014449 [Uroleucon formosanum]
MNNMCLIFQSKNFKPITIYFLFLVDRYLCLLMFDNAKKTFHVDYLVYQLIFNSGVNVDHSYDDHQSSGVDLADTNVKKNIPGRLFRALTNF